MLYHQALITEGLPIEDPTEYIKAMTALMIKANKERKRIEKNQSFF